jgi:3,4-dihydroxy 2-butanone 4-phosphate synthase / GTP cyclohydrolase II
MKMRPLSHTRPIRDYYSAALLEQDEPWFQDIEKAIEAFKDGSFLVVSDNENRENEGDLIIAAEFADANAINFMITQGKGLVCMTVTEEIARKHNLQQMVSNNTELMETAFTISVDGSPEFGVTTGISASDRARTIDLLLSENLPSNALVSPGHLFPLVAKPGGVLQRPGHTEAGVELARLAGLKPAAVIVEIIREDGEMARRPDLEVFSQMWGLNYITIENLIRYINVINQDIPEPIMEKEVFSLAA